MRTATRRSVVGGLAALTIGPASCGPAPFGPAWAEVPAAGHLAFRAERNGSAIGNHTLTFARQGEMLSVDIAVDYLVKFGPIPVFRYKLRARETWHGDVLAEIVATTNDDGQVDFMRASRGNG